MSGSIKFEKLWIQLGYCNRKSIKKFLAQNKITINHKPLSPQFKLRTIVDPFQVQLNDRPIPYLTPFLHVIFNKSPGVSTFPIFDYGDQSLSSSKNKKNFVLSANEQEEEHEVYDDEGGGDESEMMTMDEYEQYLEEQEMMANGMQEFENSDEYAKYTSAPLLSASSRSNQKLRGKKAPKNLLSQKEAQISIFDILPETFQYRKPVFNIASDLPVEFSGLTFLTQDSELTKCFSSVRNPLGRVYEVQFKDKFTGLEQEALRTLRGEIKQSVKKVINAPRFIPVNEEKRIAHITLHDYKPDNIVETLLSIRHEPVSVKRIAIGHLQLANEYLNGGGQDRESENEYIINLKENDWRVLDDDHVNYMLLDKVIQNDRRRILVQRERELKLKQNPPSKKTESKKSLHEEIMEDTKSISNVVRETLYESATEEFLHKQQKKATNPAYIEAVQKMEKMKASERQKEEEKLISEEEKMYQDIAKKYEQQEEKKKPGFKPITPPSGVMPHHTLEKMFEDESLDPNKLSKL